MKIGRCVKHEEEIWFVWLYSAAPGTLVVWGFIVLFLINVLLWCLVVQRSTWPVGTLVVWCGGLGCVFDNVAGHFIDTNQNFG